jgi:heme d1 biosynthesis radical SAM protein NirJ
MFRLSQFVKEIFEPTKIRRGAPPGPVVIWNLIRRCNLNCLHCYSLSSDTDFKGELDTGEVLSVMRDLRDFRVPVLILSGGEPLLRPDIFEISNAAKEMGFYVGLSSNGTLIDDDVAEKISAVGYDYVGISLDGIGSVHDGFRRKDGAYEAALGGMRRCAARGIKVGLRYTMTEKNISSFDGMLALLDQESIDKFYLSHLVYAGRGNRYRDEDVAHRTTREYMDRLFAFAVRDYEAGNGREIVTGNNDADGVYFLHWVRENFPHATAHIHDKLVAWGGNASGVHVANIDNLGEVHPDTMWWHHGLGNVRERPFAEIWQDTSDPIMAGLKAKPRTISGRCSACAHFDICEVREPALAAGR